ncbi:hypothetical protein JSO61_003320 [Riemerella anatipestifer]|uniref:hypothetical protein n=1 Tax=Riemerella anatipestifer TaxID=34085 RepID=UPI0030C29042
MEKEIILKAIANEQQKIVDNLQKSVERYRIESDIDEDATHDPEDFSHQTEAKDMQLRFEQMANTAKNHLAFIEHSAQEHHTSIESGCLIKTDKSYIFIGISVPPFKYEGKDVICISEEAPIYSKIKDAKVGDKVDFGSHHIEIIDIA